MNIMKKNVASFVAALAAASVVGGMGAAYGADANFIGALHVSNATFYHLEDLDISFTSQPAPLQPFVSSASYSYEGQTISSGHTFTPFSNGFSGVGSVDFIDFNKPLNPLGVQGTTLLIVAIEFEKTTPVRLQASLFGGEYVFDDQGEIVSGTFASAVVLNQGNNDEFYAFFNADGGGLNMVDEVLMLEPGIYEFGFVAQGTSPLQGESAWFDGAFTIIPSPGAATLLCIFGIGAARRRR